MNEARIIIEYAGQPTAEQDDRIDRVAATFGMEPGDTGYSFSERVRGHSIGVPEGADAEQLAAEMRSLLPTMEVRVYRPDWHELGAGADLIQQLAGFLSCRFGQPKPEDDAAD